MRIGLGVFTFELHVPAHGVEFCALCSYKLYIINIQVLFKDNFDGIGHFVFERTQKQFVGISRNVA